MTNIHTGIETAEGFVKSGGVVIDVDALDEHFNARGLSPTTIADTYQRAGIGGNRTIIFGDSIAQGSDSATGHSIGGSWFAKLCERSNQKIRYWRNSGIAGQSTVSMLARFQTDVIAHNPDICVLEAITPNDIGQSVSASTTRANITNMLDQLKTAGIRPIVCTGPPNDTAATKDRMQLDSAWLIGEAYRRGITVWDLYSPLADPADGTYLSTYTTDGTHPNAAGQDALVTALLPAIPGDITGAPFLTQSKLDATNLLTNGVFIGDTNTDGLADNWTNAGVTTTSLTPRTGAPGNWQQLASTSATGYITATVPNGAWNVGDVIAISGMWENDNSPAIIVQTNCTGGTPYSQPRALSNRADIVPATGRSFHQQFTIPTGTTAISIRLVPGIGTARFGQITIRNLTQLGMI